MAICMAAFAARSYRSTWLFSFSGWSPAPALFSALPMADLQIIRILCAASISPIGHWISSSQTSLRSLLSNHRRSALANHHIDHACNISKATMAVAGRAQLRSIQALDRRQYLSWIENIFWIERLLYRSHGINGLRAEFGL